MHSNTDCEHLDQIKDKAPIDYSQYTLGDGSTVSTQERIVKNVGTISFMPHLS